MIEAQRQEAVRQPLIAEAIYRHLLVREPAFHPAWHALGLLAYRAGEVRLAGEFISCAISVDGSVGIYHSDLTEMLLLLGYAAEAVAPGQRAVALMPNDPGAHIKLGLALADTKRYSEAISCYRRALALDPAHAVAWNNLGVALEAIEDRAGAEDAYATAVRLNPRLANAHNNLGLIYLGNELLEQARKRFEAAIAIKPDHIDAHYSLSQLKTYRADDPHLASLEVLLPSTASMAMDSRIRFFFALGKAREDAGRYDEAFAAYAEGNSLQYSLRRWDDAKAVRMLNNSIALFKEEFFTARPPAVDDFGITPIFIVGMPRSGTTLIEQILASHPRVFGAGEFMSLNDAVMDISHLTDIGDLPAWASEASAEDFAAVGRACLARLSKAASGKVVIVDKTPGHFFLIGIIRLALPKAKIIHSLREPMDSCISCYTRFFNADNMAFTFDLGDLGRYCARYLKLMEHWHRVLPAGAILDVRYEDLVAETESQVRRLLEYVGLPWDEACLAFHRNKRQVRTASLAQVRKPIYRTSLARWQHFEQHLQPLRDALESIK
jgi:tetratricopeptide (TPR) repeat protein